MSRLLILGSKPDPVIPDASTYTEFACVNGSGFSAAKQGLGPPAFTVMTANLTSGTGSGAQSIQAISGLGTRKLYYLAKPGADYRKRGLRRRIKYYRSLLRMRPQRLIEALEEVGYRHEEFIVYAFKDYYKLVLEVCRQDPAVCASVAKKQPSTGIYTLILGLASGRYERFILSGFSLEGSHAYLDKPGENALCEPSRHAQTDIAVLRALSRVYGDNLVTTEVKLSEQTGVPLMEPAKSVGKAAPSSDAKVQVTAG